MGLGWRVEWGFGLWFFHLLLYPTINSCNPFNYGLSIYGRNKDNYPIQLSYFVAWILGNNIKYMGVLRPSKWRKKKRQARADCVRPSRVPTILYIKSLSLCVRAFMRLSIRRDVPRQNWILFRWVFWGKLFYGKIGLWQILWRCNHV
jgi:hypothetical protein